MVKFRNASDERRLVGYGTRRQWVEPDGVIAVQDEAAGAYDCQDIWEKFDGDEKVSLPGGKDEG